MPRLVSCELGRFRLHSALRQSVCERPRPYDGPWTIAEHTGTYHEAQELGLRSADILGGGLRASFSCALVIKQPKHLPQAALCYFGRTTSQGDRYVNGFDN